MCCRSKSNIFQELVARFELDGNKMWKLHVDENICGIWADYYLIFDLKTNGISCHVGLRFYFSNGFCGHILFWEQSKCAYGNQKE